MGSTNIITQKFEPFYRTPALKLHYAGKRAEECERESPWSRGNGLEMLHLHQAGVLPDRGPLRDAAAWAPGGSSG